MFQGLNTSYINFLESRVKVGKYNTIIYFTDKLLELMKIAELPNIVTDMQSCDSNMVAEHAKEVAAILSKG